MPTTDAYGQGTQIAALTDAPNAEKLAFDIVNQLVPRGVMRFASASARNAAIPSPAAGMQAWITAEGLMTIYDGTQWAVGASGAQAWRNVSLASPWQSPDSSDTNNNNGRLQYRVVDLFGERTIMFRGAIGRTSYPTDTPSSFIITSTPLPADARPVTLRSIVVPCSDANSNRISLKCDLRTNGDIVVLGTGDQPGIGTVKPPWIGFNGTFCSL